ncbi:MAG: tryptophan-rich sensory protein [Rhodothermales bacterium]|nr:tryptophan-rich sensory protein [Rhodothermales bacterium]
MNTATSRTRDILGLVGWLLAAFAAAAIGGLASANSASFYQDLIRPDWSPPGWLFGPVWTLLYTLMAISAWMVWRKAGFQGARTGLTLFLVQLVANGLWTWLFFVWTEGAWAFIEILVLWALILATIVHFRKVSRVAAGLLLPYLAWVSFAAALTFATWRLNPELLG